MADYIRPTPRNPFLGGLADLLEASTSPERTQQMQGIMSMLGVPAVASTLNRMSYGAPLTSGAGGLGGTTRVLPDVLEAAMTVAPMAPAAGQLAKRAVMATKGLPVGASIRDVGAKFNVASKDASEIFGSGATRFKYTEPQSGGSMEILARPDGSASVLSLEVPEKFRGMKIGESLQSQAMQDFPVLQGQVSSKAAAKTAYRLGRRPPNEPNATLDDVYKIMDEYSSVNLVSPQMQRSFNPAFQYPQEEAMRLAQQRAALPVEQYGLGLPADNTAQQRAAAMGFDYNTTRFHGSDQDIYAFDPARFGRNDQGWYGRGVTTDTDPEIASGYANFNEAESGQAVYPLVSKGKYMVWPEGQQPFSSAKDSIRGTKDIQGLGYQGTRMTNDRDLYGNNPMFGTEQVTFNPDDIRSINAAFDPFRRNAAIATATGALAPDLLAAQEDEAMRQRQLGLMGTIAP